MQVSGGCRSVGLRYLPQQVLLQVVVGQQHLPPVLPTLQLVVLALPPQQAGLLLRLHLLQTLLLPDQPLLLLPLGCQLVLVQLLSEQQENMSFEEQHQRAQLLRAQLRTSFSCSLR